MRWARANSNLALVKYWGKLEGTQVNQAARGSISVTLDGLTCDAGVEFDGTLSEDQLDAPHAARPALSAFLDVARSELRIRTRARVRVRSSFPVAAGLASSASTFAALALAAAAAAETSLSPARLAWLARRGSGSAGRSIPGGFVEWRPGAAEEIVRLAPADHWSLSVLVAIVSDQPKTVGSREGMARTAATSPYFPAWLECGSLDLDPVRDAIRTRDLAALGRHAERNSLRMHAAAIAADPPLLYWEPATLAVIREVRRLRDEEGVDVWFSIDAGPQVKVLCEPSLAARVGLALNSVPGVLRVLHSKPGGPARLLDSDPCQAAPSAGAEAR